MEERRFKRRVAVDLRRRGFSPSGATGLKADAWWRSENGSERAALPRCRRRFIRAPRPETSDSEIGEAVAENHHFRLNPARRAVNAHQPLLDSI